MGKKCRQKKRRILEKKLQADETPADRKFEVTQEDLEAAGERPEPFNEIRREENIVALKPNAFAPFSFEKYEPTADDLQGDPPFPDPDDEKNYQLYLKECVETELNSNFVLERIVKCNYTRGTTYFATIEVRDGDDEVTKEYQAEVRRNHFTGKTFVCKFRPRPVYPTSYA